MNVTRRSAFGAPSTARRPSPVRLAGKDIKREALPGTPPTAPAEPFAPIELDASITSKLRPIKYDGASPFAGRLHEIVGWDTWPMEKRVAFLRDIVEDTSKDPAIVKKATSILTEAGVAVRDHRAAWGALLKWVQTNIRYENEWGERVQSPQYTLSHPQAGADCDDLAVLLAALGNSLRLPWKFTLSGRSHVGEKIRWVEGEGRCPRNADWSHIYLCVGWPPFRPTQWVFAEPTLKVALGWDTMSARGAPQGREDMAGVLTNATSWVEAHPVKSLLLTVATGFALRAAGRKSRR